MTHTVKLKNQNGNVFYDKLTYIYLEMPNFIKQGSELTTRLDKWLYFIKYLEDFQNIPSLFKDEIFIQAFAKAELANLGQAEMDKYENSLKVYRDLKGAIDNAFEEGKTERSIEIAKSAKQMELPTQDISKLTGLSEDEINKL